MVLRAVSWSNLTGARVCIGMRPKAKRPPPLSLKERLAGDEALKLWGKYPRHHFDNVVVQLRESSVQTNLSRHMHEYGVEKLLRDAKLTQIYEGTNQINRLEIMEAVMGEIGA
jgi:alkylation response protein AidB-like acyl-CoA dehydrogenase